MTALLSEPRTRDAAPQATISEPVVLQTLAYAAASYFAAEPQRGSVYITDGEDGRWMPGWAEGAETGYADQHYWIALGYRITHFAPYPAAPIDGVTV